MWSLRTVATCVLLTTVMVASTTQVLEQISKDESYKNTSDDLKLKAAKTVYYKPKPKTKNIGREQMATGTSVNDERLSKMSSLNRNFWVYGKLSNRSADPQWNEKSDCFYKNRKSMRWYPSVSGVFDYCYSMDFSPPRKTAWWNFWPEIRGDLQYAFDFVMWDEYEQYHETNSFWYLMLYLKSLLQRIRNPNMVAHSHRPMFDSRRSGNQSMLQASDLNEPVLNIPEHEPLRELLTEYREKVKHLESLLL